MAVLEIETELKILAEKLNSDDILARKEAKRVFKEVCSTEALCKLYGAAEQKDPLRNLVRSAVSDESDELPSLVGEQMIAFLRVASCEVFDDPFILNDVILCLLCNSSLSVVAVGSRLLLEFFSLAKRLRIALAAEYVSRIESAMEFGCCESRKIQKRPRETCLDEETPRQQFDTFMRFLDCSGNSRQAVVALLSHCPTFVQRFMQVVAKLGLRDVLLFLNFLAAAQLVVVCGGVDLLPEGLATTVSHILTSDEVEASLARPSVICFAGTIITVSPTYELSARWVRILLSHLQPGSEEAVEIIGQVVGSSVAGLELVSCEDPADRWIRHVWQGIKSGTASTRMACLRALQNSIDGPAKTSSSSIAEKFFACKLLPQEDFRAALWPLRTHFEIEVRIVVWKLLGALTAVPHDSVIRVFAHTVASFLAGPETEISPDVRDAQRHCAHQLLNSCVFEAAEQGSAAHTLKQRLASRLADLHQHQELSVGTAAA